MAIARPVDRRLFFLFDRAHAQLSKSADAYLGARSKIGTAQAAALIYLGYHDHCTLTELAQGVGRNNSATTELVTRMIASGLVDRTPSRMDRRTKAVSLTDLGWERRESVMSDFRDFNDRLVKGLKESEIEAVFKFLSLAPENVS